MFTQVRTRYMKIVTVVATSFLLKNPSFIYERIDFCQEEPNCPDPYPQRLAHLDRKRASFHAELPRCIALATFS